MRGTLRLVAGTASLAAGGWLVRALHGAPDALGAHPASIAAVTAGSPHYRDGVFVNLEPASEIKMDREQLRLVAWELIGNRGGSRPKGPIPLASPGVLDADPSRLAVSWFGHSTALLEIDGYRVLTDPVWSDRCSPSDVVGPQRLHPPPIQLEALPAVDAVVISHDHYDHLDIDTVLALARTQRAPFFVPLGIGAHLRAVGDTRAPHRRARLASERQGRRARRWCACRRGISRDAFWTAIRRCGRRGRSSARRIAHTSAATPATPRASRRSAPITDRST